MKVRVLPSATQLDVVSAVRWRRLHDAHNDYFLHPEQVFTVYGIRFADDEVWYLLLNPTGYLQEVAAVFFDVADRRISRHWVYQAEGMGARLHPPEIIDDAHFLDSMADLDSHTLAIWSQIRRRFDDEFGGKAMTTAR